MDVLGLFALGGALPSAMTGNTALLGLALGRAHLVAAAPPLCAGIGFVLGVMAAAAALHFAPFETAGRARGLVRLLGLEVILLAVFCFAWQVTGKPADLSLYILIVLAAASMGIQSVVAGQEGRPGITTVVFTSTLAAIVIAVTGALLASPRRLAFAAKRQMVMFAAYGFGAVLGGFLTCCAVQWVPWLPLGAALGALFLRRRRIQERPAVPGEGN